jgi:copper chaperone
MVKLKVQGMSCEHCVRAVNSALAEVEGVDRVIEVSLERGEAIVDGDPAISALIAAIAEEGYSAESVE